MAKEPGSSPVGRSLVRGSHPPDGLGWACQPGATHRHRLRMATFSDSLSAWAARVSSASWGSIRGWLQPTLV
jgi:hypothetical protein